ncbi:MAG: protein translocase subunit SecD [Alphaproteobacteria bacterium]
MVNISRFQRYTILIVCLLGLLFALPNMFTKEQVEKWPGWLPKQQFALGLDLQGGAYLLLEVDSKSVLSDQLRVIRAAVRAELRKPENNIIWSRAPEVVGNTVTFTIRDAAQLDKTRTLMRKLITDFSGTSTIDGTGAPYQLTIADTGQATIRMTDDGVRLKVGRVMDQIIEVIRRRVDPTGTKEISIQRQGFDRILLEIPGVGEKELAEIKDRLKQAARLSFHMLDLSAQPAPNMTPPPGSRLVLGQTGEPYLIFDDPEVTGENLVDAQQSFDQGRPVVSFRFDSTGARKFGDVTRKNIGKPFAIVLDNKVISAPVIQSAITGGSGIITGGFTVKSASELALLLRAGALPAGVTVLEERTVGPGLGQDSIDAGKFAAILGVIFVVAYMVVGYTRFGLMADAALVMNVILLTAVMSLLQATLTLPGIAGIVLTVGMAVDANVLIFERIREESMNGRTPIAAIDAGFRRAWATIVDSHVTTLIAALLLYFFGSGPIRGFGVTLAIGILLSLFTAVSVTRLLIVFWLRRNRPSVLKI